MREERERNEKKRKLEKYCSRVQIRPDASVYMPLNDELSIHLFAYHIRPITIYVTPMHYYVFVCFVWNLFLVLSQRDNSYVFAHKNQIKKCFFIEIDFAERARRSGREKHRRKVERKSKILSLTLFCQPFYCNRFIVASMWSNSSLWIIARTYKLLHSLRCTFFHFTPATVSGDSALYACFSIYNYEREKQIFMTILNCGREWASAKCNGHNWIILWIDLLICFPCHSSIAHTTIESSRACVCMLCGSGVKESANCVAHK